MRIPVDSMPNSPADSVIVDSIALSSPDSVAADVEEDELLEPVRVTTLDGVEILAGRQKYSKKNNPAYDLMKRIRAARDLNDPRMLPEYTEDYYSKIVLGLNDCDASQFTGRDRLKFLEEYVDTSAHTHLPVLLVSLREKAGTRVHSLNFLKDKDIIKAGRSVGVDDGFDQKNVTKLLEDVLRDVDIYKDDINIMQNRFVSPLSHIADNYYKYFINDTVKIDGRPHIELTFAPRTRKVSVSMVAFSWRMPTPRILSAASRCACPGSSTSIISTTSISPRNISKTNMAKGI